ncbi:MAG: PilZ domain-containing protein [Chloroflexota bacterium]
MTRTPSRPKRKSSPRKPSAERRRAPRGNLKLLTAFRCLDVGKESLTGFVRALNLSPIGALLESPDAFTLGQTLALEFLLDNNRIAQTDGRVTRVRKREKFYHVAVEFAKVSPKARRLIQLQVG